MADSKRDEVQSGLYYYCIALEYYGSGVDPYKCMFSGISRCYVAILSDVFLYWYQLW